MPRKPKPPRAFIYCRKALPYPKPFEVQESQCREYCHQQGYEVVEVLHEDDNVTSINQSSQLQTILYHISMALIPKTKTKPKIVLISPTWEILAGTVPLRKTLNYLSGEQGFRIEVLQRSIDIKELEQKALLKLLTRKTRF